MRSVTAAALAAWLLGSASVALACDPAGRIDFYGLADAAPLVVVGSTSDGHRLDVLHVLKGARPRRGLRLVLPGGNCDPRIEAGQPYVFFLRPNGVLVGAYESARAVGGEATAAATARAELVVTLRRWLATRDRDARRQMLVEIAARVGPAAREAARTLSVARGWAHVPGHSLGEHTPAECAQLRAARGLTDPAWSDRASTIDRLLVSCAGR